MFIHYHNNSANNQVTNFYHEPITVDFSIVDSMADHASHSVTINNHSKDEKAEAD